jgi:hypothetical protein
MDNTRGWFVAIGVLVIFALAAFGVVWVVRDTIQRTVSPVQAVTGNLGTRVAEILNPTPTVLPDPVTIIHSVRSLARLETIHYTIEKVITAETGQGAFSFLFGDRLILVAHGIVIGGVDLAKLAPSDLTVRDGVLYVRLPEPEIFIATLDNEKSYIYGRDTGVLTHGDINLETTARTAAEDEIEKAALEDGILPLAQQNAEHYLERLLRDLGYPEVIFVHPTPVPG